MHTIFVQIAAYKETDLQATLNDLFMKATYPQNITVSVCYQGDYSDIKDMIRMNNVRWIYVPEHNTFGLGQARALAQTNYNRQDYCLQLDAHHRFRQGWDVFHIEQIELLRSKGHAKPVLTTYAGPYNPKTGELTCSVDQGSLMFMKEFRENGYTIPFFFHWFTSNAPIPARAVSGHYIFTVGDFAEEHRYDPYSYFFGEELSLTVRLYTMGYDLFHPHKMYVYHRYGWEIEDESGQKKKLIKHWDEHYISEREQGWFRRLRKLTGQKAQFGDDREKLGAFGLGNTRTIAEYESYSGINFLQRKIDNSGWPVGGYVDNNTIKKIDTWNFGQVAA